VRDGLSERTGLCALGVEVNPLMVACGVCEELYLLLGDGDVIAVTEMLANVSHEVCLIFDDGCHDFSVAEKADQVRT